MNLEEYKKTIKENRRLIVESFMQQASTSVEFVDTWLDNVESELVGLLKAVRNLKENVTSISAKEIARQAKDFYRLSNDHLSDKIADFADALKKFSSPNSVEIMKVLRAHVVVRAAKLTALCEELKEEAISLRDKVSLAGAKNLVDVQAWMFINEVADADIDKIVDGLKKGDVPFV